MAQNPHRSQPKIRHAASKTGTVPVGAKILAQHSPSNGSSEKKLAQQEQKRQIWGVVSVQGELFRTRTIRTSPIDKKSHPDMTHYAAQ